MNAGTLTLSTFDRCHYQIGRADAPDIKARGVIQTTIMPDTGGAVIDITLSGNRKHQRIMASMQVTAADLDGLIGQLTATRDMLRTHREGRHDS